MKRVSTDEFIAKAHKKHGNKFNYSKVKYVKACIKVKIGCKTHGYWEQRPNDHLTGYGCPQCKFDLIASQKRSTADEFICKAHLVHNNEYDYSNVVYANAITKVEIVCKQHGAFLQTPDKHLGGTACPKCSHGISRAEKQIQKVLEDKKIKYVFNKTFPGLRGKTKNAALRYDFWLPEYNLLVEYDGEQHFSPVQTKGRISKRQAVIKHNATKINDKKKNAYAKKHGIELLRIKYDQPVIPSFLQALEKLPLKLGE